MNIKIWISAVVGCMFLAISCGDKEGNSSVYDPGREVVRTSFYPDSGKIAERVLLTGDNFGSDPGKIRVYFNQKRAAVVRSSGSMIYAIVPRMPGDTCVVSVAVGDDSAAYAHPFRYFQSVSVQTVTGNGERLPVAGTLDRATLSPLYLAVDGENNVFVTVGESRAVLGFTSETNFGIFKINEAANAADILVMEDAWSKLAANGLCVDMNTGIVLVAGEGKIEEFFTLDPRENFAPRRRNLLITKTNGHPLPDYINGVAPGKHSMAWCKADGKIYGKWYSGQVFRMDPATYEAEIIGVVKDAAGGTWPGFANHPIHTEWMYMSARSGSSAPGIWKFNINDFAGTLTRLHSGVSGHRDGPIGMAQFNEPWQIFFDPDGSLYVADAGNHCIRRITPDERLVETILGVPGKDGWKDGTKEEALFFAPRGIGVTKDGTVYVADWGNRRLRKLIVE
ncbi:MAG: IPT/TIG domain-containing protein [Bacteroidales bacterium]|jgi:DNA-binding beta-propeller fold protein YncE|nr:IPT/TIG domain-containing protein [Bacteroidales bacterium]